MKIQSHTWSVLLALAGSAMIVAAQQPPAKAPIKPAPTASIDASIDARVDKDKKATGKAANKPENKGSEGSAKKAEEKAELTPQQERSLLVLEQAASDAASLSNKRIIAKLQAAAAAALWDHRPDQARELFRSAFDFANKHYRETGDTNSDKVARSAYLTRTDQRLEIIKQAKTKDAELGRELTEKYVEEKQREREENRAKPKNLPPGREVFGNAAGKGADILEAATQLLSVDKNAAIEIAKKALAIGVSQAAPGFFGNLAAKDRASADALFLFALDRLAQEPLPHAGQLLLLAPYAFGEETAVASNGQSISMMHVFIPKDFVVSEPLAQRFIAVAFGVLSRHAEEVPVQTEEQASRFAVALFAAQYLVPRLEKHQPALLPEWQGLITRLSPLVAEKTRKSVGDSAKRDDSAAREPAKESGDQAKSLLDKAEQTADLKQRDNIYREAAMVVGNSGDYARALDIADRITDLEFRLKVRSWLSFEASQDATKKGKLDEAKRYALNVSETDQRAWLFLEMARAALKNSDRVKANDLLSDALKFATEADHTPAKVRALSGIANVYAGFDLQRGFDVAGEIVRTVNRLKEPLSDQAQLVRLFEGGGMTMINSQDAEEFDAAGTIALLAKQDFERALTLTQYIENPQMKISSLIAVAASAFAKKKEQ